MSRPLILAILALPMLRVGMAGHIANAIEQRAQQWADGNQGKAAMVGPGFIEPVRVAPFPIGRQCRRQSRHVRAFMSQAGRVGIGQRFGDIQTDMAGIPFVGKADVEQMGGQRKLDDNAGLVEHLGHVMTVKTFFEAPKEGFRIMVAETTEAPTLSGSDQARWRIVILVMDRG